MWKNVYKRKRLTTWTYANDMKINIGEKIILCLYFIIVHTNTNTHSRQTAYHPFFLHSVKKAQNIFPCIQLNRSILTNFMLQRCYSCALCVCVWAYDYVLVYSRASNSFCMRCLPVAGRLFCYSEMSLFALGTIFGLQIQQNLPHTVTYTTPIPIFTSE